jgi:hypothetical protein
LLAKVRHFGLFDVNKLLKEKKNKKKEQMSIFLFAVIK